MKKVTRRQAPRHNQLLRTRKALLDAAARLIRRGSLPTMEEVATEAMVSRPTAYRYFRSVDVLLNEAALEESMAIPDDLFEGMKGGDPEDRLMKAEALMHGYCQANETKLRLLLANSVNRNPEEDEIPVRQNRRLPLIEAALAPSRTRFKPAAYRKLCSALALIFGTESMIVFRDVLRADDDTAREVKAWAIRALVRGALDGKLAGS